MTPPRDEDSLRAAIAGAPDAQALVDIAASARALARERCLADAPVRATTALISEFNDRITERLVRLQAQALGLDLGRACWMVFGSQARREQTLATDQDNGLLFEGGADAPAERARWLELGHRVNLALDACGYALCRGHVMAGEAECCRTLDAWAERFETWMRQGTPEHLLAASIYFDLRPVVGRADLVERLREGIRGQARALPRFQKQLADNALLNPAALTWWGGIRASRRDGHDRFDLKLRGSALFVEAARLLALAQGVDATGTLERLERAAGPLHVPHDELDAWCRGFESLQRLRLQAQARGEVDPAHPNSIDLARLAPDERDALQQALRAARLLQQRIALDYATR